MSESAIIEVHVLGSPPWRTWDPFLFCVHHHDDYPAGNGRMGVESAALRGRQMGMDFSGREGWSMYHGDEVPGFPQHPHRGFETITIARNGYIDHTDSMGATARFGHGDVQWMTAGKGVVHSEMFPLVNSDAPNPTELFQIWLNLPASDKMVEPYFTMLWNDKVPRQTLTDATGRGVELRVVAGHYGSVEAPAPPPNSWAARGEADVAIWTLRLEAGATVRLPAGPAGVNRTLYFFAGSTLQVDDTEVASGHSVRLDPTREVVLTNGETAAEVLMLQGRPIGEPVAQHGPFVMNTRAEIVQAFTDYQRTQFGGWPWPSHGPVHPADETRFALHADGRREEP